MTHVGSAAGAIRTNGPKETLRAGRLLGSCARGGDVLALSGGLGAGKTVLVKGLADGMGIAGAVPSPTFNLLLVHAGEPPLYHFDLYRLETSSQLEDLDFYEVAEEGGGVTAIEWSDKFPGAMPPDRLDVVIETASESERVLELYPSGPRSAEWARCWRESWAIS